LIGWLGLETTILVILATGMVVLVHGIPEGQQVWQVFWHIMSQALTSNPVDAGNPWPYLLIMMMVTLGSLFMVSILIGTLTSSIEAKVEDLRKGRSQVFETGHTLILGWSPQVFTIVSAIGWAPRQCAISSRDIESLRYPNGLQVPGAAS